MRSRFLQHWSKVSKGGLSTCASTTISFIFWRTLAQRFVVLWFGNGAIYPVSRQFLPARKSNPHQSYCSSNLCNNFTKNFHLATKTISAQTLLLTFQAICTFKQCTFSESFLFWKVFLPTKFGLYMNSSPRLYLALPYISLIKAGFAHLWGMAWLVLYCIAIVMLIVISSNLLTEVVVL